MATRFSGTTLGQLEGAEATLREAERLVRQAIEAEVSPLSTTLLKDAKILAKAASLLLSRLPQ